MFEFKQGNYYHKLVTCPYPEEIALSGDFMGMVWHDVENDRYLAAWRFRTHVDNNAFNSDDKKDWDNVVIPAHGGTLRKFAMAYLWLTLMGLVKTGFRDYGVPEEDICVSAFQCVCTDETIEEIIMPKLQKNKHLYIATALETPEQASRSGQN